jgi:hypothetical protein
VLVCAELTVTFSFSVVSFTSQSLLRSVTSRKSAPFRVRHKPYPATYVFVLPFGCWLSLSPTSSTPWRVRLTLRLTYHYWTPLGLPRSTGRRYDWFRRPLCCGSIGCQSWPYRGWPLPPILDKMGFFAPISLVSFTFQVISLTQLQSRIHVLHHASLSLAQIGPVTRPFIRLSS